MKSRVSNVPCWTVFWCSACPSRTQCVSHFCLALQVRNAFHEAPSTEAKRDLTDQGRELYKGINNPGNWRRELCRFSALFHLSNSIFHRAIKIFPWLHNRWTFSFAAYTRNMLMLWFLLTTMRLTSLVSVENTEYLMLNSLFSCQPQSTLQIEFDYKQVTFLTGCFMIWNIFWSFCVAGRE